MHKYQREYLTNDQQNTINKNTVITKRCFGGLINCEYHHKNKPIKVTYHPYKFLGGGVCLWVGKLLVNNKVIFTAKNHEELLKKYCLEVMK